MAVKCNGCGAEFEKRGKYCPSCGRAIEEIEPNGTTDNSNNSKGIIGVYMAVLVIILLIIFCVHGCDGNDIYDDDLDEEIVLELPKTPSGVLTSYGKDYGYLYDDYADADIVAMVKVEKVERLGTIRYVDESGYVEFKFTVTMLYNSKKRIAENSYIKYGIKNSSGETIEYGWVCVPEINQGDTIEVNHYTDILSADDSYELYFYS